MFLMEIELCLNGGNWADNTVHNHTICCALFKLIYKFCPYNYLLELIVALHFLLCILSTHISFKTVLSFAPVLA
jgi:hypothetical protein